MNPILQLCPQCNKHTNIQIDKDNIHINCQCGYNSIMNVNNVINQMNHSNHYKSETFTNISNDINKGY